MVSAIRKVCQQFVALCRDIKLLDSNIVAIDGSRFKAVNSKAKELHARQAEAKAGRDRQSHRGLSAMELDRADEALAKTGSTVPTSQVVRASRKLAHPAQGSGALSLQLKNVWMQTAKRRSH